MFQHAIVQDVSAEGGNVHDRLAPLNTHWTVQCF